MEAVSCQGVEMRHYLDPLVNEVDDVMPQRLDCDKDDGGRFFLGENRCNPGLGKDWMKFRSFQAHLDLLAAK